MKTNDLKRSKGWDQGWGILHPSQFPTWEINEGREQPTLCIIYSLRPLNPMSVVCCPPVGLIGTLFTAQTGGCCVADPKLPMFMFDILYQDGCNDVLRQFITCSTSGYSSQSYSLCHAHVHTFFSSPTNLQWIQTSTNQTLHLTCHFFLNTLPSNRWCE